MFCAEKVLLDFTFFRSDPNKTHTGKFPGSTGPLGSMLPGFFCDFFAVLHRLGHEATHPLGGVLLHFVGHMGICIEREPGAVVPQDAGDRFGVHALLDRQGCECLLLIRN